MFWGFILTKWYVKMFLAEDIFYKKRSFILTKWYVKLDGLGSTSSVEGFYIN
ncbi:hypothetical protein [Clostridioides difficile]|uniref:hypothetical protein n=1 Tax=Clostridioides difficile TaxID=1496 RepID=UPI003A8C101E